MPKSRLSDKRRSVRIKLAEFTLYSEKDFLAIREPTAPKQPQAGTNKEQGQ